MANSNDILAVRNLRKSFGSSPVLTGIDFSVAKGEKVCIVGPSGSGKTTFLRCLNLLVEPSAGELFFHGDCVGRWPKTGKQTFDVRQYRSRVAMVFQHFELFPHLSALENVTLGPVHVRHQSKSAANKSALAFLDRVGLRSQADAHPRTLSGGQQQRVAIARALAMEPDLVLFDEPTSALDAEMVGEVLTIMEHLAHEGLTMLIVTHELEFARRCADRIVVMENGEIIEEGPTAQMFAASRVQRTREILGQRPYSAGREAESG